jgi:hypothetical protein
MARCPTICFHCRRPLTGEGYGRAPGEGSFVHVGCYRDDIARQGLTRLPLEDLHWHVGERVTFVQNGEVRLGIIVGLAGPDVRVLLRHDQAPVLVDAATLWPTPASAW